MISDSAQLTNRRLRGAEGALYDIQMEAAAKIHKAANDLKIQNHNLEMHGFKEAHLIWFEA